MDFRAPLKTGGGKKNYPKLFKPEGQRLGFHSFFPNLDTANIPKKTENIRV